MTRACMCVIILNRIMWAPGQSELSFVWKPLVSEVFLFFLNSCWPVKIIFLWLNNYFRLQKKNNYFPLLSLWQPLKDSELKKHQHFHQLRSHPTKRFSLGHVHTLKRWAIPFSQMSSCNTFKYALDISYLKHEETYMCLFKACWFISTILKSCCFIKEKEPWYCSLICASSSSNEESIDYRQDQWFSSILMLWPF